MGIAAAVRLALLGGTKSRNSADAGGRPPLAGISRACAFSTRAPVTSYR